MTEFFTSLIYISAAGGLLIHMLPCSSPLEKHMKYAVGLMTAFFIIMSVTPLFSSVGDFFENFRDFLTVPEGGGVEEPGADDWIISESTENIEKAVVEAVSKKFRVSPECVVCEAVIDSSDKSSIIIDKIIITLVGDGRYISSASVREYVSDLLMCKCEVYYEGEK